MSKRKRRREVNPIDVVEAAYDLEGDERAWLSRLAQAVRPLLDVGAGLMAYTYDESRSVSSWYRNAIMLDIDRRAIPSFVAMHGPNPQLTQVTHFQSSGLLSLVDLAVAAGFGDPLQRPEIARGLGVLGARDMVALQTIEPGGKGVVFASGVPTVKHWSARSCRLWARVNAHIAAGQRLREALAKHRAPEEAILDPRGKVHHAEGEGTGKTARALLRDAVLRAETSRGKRRRTDPEGATEAWTALVSGRWSLVDRFERSGRRYIVARRNEYTLPDPRALTPRERAIVHLAALGKSNKLIGYELGLSESTVSSHLSSSMRKLGARTRVELIFVIANMTGQR